MVVIKWLIKKRGSSGIRSDENHIGIKKQVGEWDSLIITYPPSLPLPKTLLLLT